MFQLNEKEVRKLYQQVTGSFLEDREIAVRENWLRLHLTKWLERIMQDETGRKFAEDEETLKTVYTMALDNTLAAMQKDGRFGRDAAKKVRITREDILGSGLFNDTFHDAYARTAGSILARPVHGGTVVYFSETDGCAVERLQVEGKEVYRLRDVKSNASFDIAPAVGATITSFVVQEQEILHCPAINGTRGIPFMWPFGNRIANNSFVLDDNRVDLSDAPYLNKDGNGNVMHGMARNLPWKVEKIGSDKNGIFIICSLDIKDYSGTEKYPGRGTVALTYRLNGAELSLSASTKNTGKGTFPVAPGWHPWFKTEGRDGWKASLPGNKSYPSDKQLPTGRPVGVGGTDLDFRNETSLEGKQVDAVFTDLNFHDGVATSTLADTV
ncbi:MAG: aldose 1-epimerase, partial [Candidatus Omnitrophica bacterium]|nr:aldose 1-epimerase [Candidatus Omnitrophota bacterium]